MIRGMHGMFYSSDAVALRAFFRDKLGFPAVDVGDGWLIFDMPEADLGVHPTGPDAAPSGTASVSFYCDDIEATVRELTARGVEFVEPPEARPYGIDSGLRDPSGNSIRLTQVLETVTP